MYLDVLHLPPSIPLIAMPSMDKKKAQLKALHAKEAANKAAERELKAAEYVRDIGQLITSATSARERCLASSRVRFLGLFAWPQRACRV